jgi:hypothetical protein
LNETAVLTTIAGAHGYRREGLTTFPLHTPVESNNRAPRHHHANAAKEVYVHAGKRMRGMFFGEEVGGLVAAAWAFLERKWPQVIHRCGLPFAFDFAKNQDPEVKYHFIPRPCHVSISQIVANGRDWSCKQVARFDTRTNPVTQACLEQFKKVRLY